MLPNFEYFQIIFEDLGLFSSFWKFISPRKKWETWAKSKTESLGFWKKYFGSDTDAEIGLWFRFPIPKPGMYVVHFTTFMSSEPRFCGLFFLETRFRNKLQYILIFTHSETHKKSWCEILILTLVILLLLSVMVWLNQVLFSSFYHIRVYLHWFFLSFSIYQ